MINITTDVIHTSHEGGACAMKKLTHLALSLVVISTVVIFDPLGLHGLYRNEFCARAGCREGRTTRP